MPTVLTHVVAGAALGAVLLPDDAPRRVRLTGMALAALPDVDVAGFAFGVPYASLLGHRGLSHSLAFAAIVALATVPLVAGRGASRAWTWLSLFVATASHGVLDTFTDGGLGVALLAPFDDTRWFAPWRPIHVSPIGLRPFLEGRGGAVLWSELVWVWLPCAVVAAVATTWRRRVVRH